MIYIPPVGMVLSTGERLMRLASIIAAVALGATAPASAETIAKFNEAILAGDVKAATAAAAGAWSSLDPTRDDYPLIAKEFGYAAYRAGDMEAAKKYASAAADAACAETPTEAEHATSVVLLRAAELAVEPAKFTRDFLYKALEERTKFPSADLISVVAARALVEYDSTKGDFGDMAASARLAERFTRDGNFNFTVVNRKFQLRTLVADYLATQQAPPRSAFRNFFEMIKDDINAAPSDELGQAYVDTYWEGQAWWVAIDGITARQRPDSSSDKKEADDKAQDEQPGEKKPFDPSLRSARLLSQHDPARCQFAPVMSTFPYLIGKPSARYGNFLGAIVVEMDVDKRGRTKNHRVIASIPEAAASPKMINYLDDIRFSKGKVWDNACTLERQNYTLTIQFMAPS